MHVLGSASGGLRQTGHVTLARLDICREQLWWKLWPWGQKRIRGPASSPPGSRQMAQVAGGV